MSGGAIGEGIVLDFTKHMHEVVDISRDSDEAGHARVQPGMYYRDFEKQTLQRNLQYPTFPASRDLCAIGGIVGNNAGGERSLRFGQSVDWVRSVRAVLADGSVATFGPLDAAGLDAKKAQQDMEGAIYRGMYNLIAKHRDTIARMRPNVSKNSAGYYLWRVMDKKAGTFDLSKLLVGSQGTLAVTTEATLGLVRPLPERAMCVVFLSDLSKVGEAVNSLLELRPEALESFDDKTLWFTMRFLPDFVRLLGASNIISLGLRFLPEAWLALRGGMPKLILMAEFSADTHEAARSQALIALDRMHRMGLNARLTKDTDESHKYWTIRRQSFNVIRSHTRGKRTTPFIDDIIVRPSDMPTFLPKLQAILEPYKLILTIAGHPGNGNFHIIPLMDMADPKNHAVITELAPKVYDLVLQYGGSITAEHNDGIIRGPWLAKQFGVEAYELFREVKRIWDPQNILNPGKKVNVDWNWALSHLRTD
jgi:FAD/FMN-containing dehydrogenase